MKKIALLASGTLVLLGGLFYGLSLEDPQPAGQPVLAVPGPTKPAKNPAASATSVSIPAPASSPGIGTEELTASVAETSGTRDGNQVRQTAGIQVPGNTRASGNRDSSKPRPVDASAAPAGDDPTAQAPIGIRLAPDVRLPVAAMPLNFKVSPVAQKAIDQIVKDYYRELASPPPGDQSGDANASAAGLIEESENGELTRVITNGPAVDAARKRADYRFKALFGNDAYNRMTMSTLLEARTPVTPQN